MSTWRYVSEARGHLVEVYADLLGMSHEPPIRHFVGMHVTEEQLAANSKVLDDWYEQRLSRLMEIIKVLERCKRVGRDSCEILEKLR